MAAAFPGLAFTAGIKQVIDVVNNILRGKTNNVTTVTLTANASSTTLTDSRIGVASFIGLQPTTANAATALATTRISETGRVNGSVVITHANDANTDKTFRVAIIG